MFKFSIFRRLVHYAEAHHDVPEVVREKRHLGIILTLLGWEVLALYTVVFQEISFNSGVRRTSVSHSFAEFFILNFAICALFFLFCIPKGIRFFRCKHPVLVFTRAIVAIISFWTYSLSRVWTTSVDNSMLYSTDAFWLVLMLAALGIPIRKTAVIGIVIGLVGIGFIYTYDLSSWHDMLGGVWGLLSAITLAIIILLTSFMVKRDPPIRIGFYHGLVGTVTSAPIALIAGWPELSLTDVVAMLLTGVFFALALFCFLESLLYAEAYVVGAVGYFLPVFIIALSWILFQEPVPLRSIIGCTIITIGGLIVIFDSYQRTPKGTRILSDGSLQSV